MILRGLRLNALGVMALAERDLRRFFRQRSRIAGALGQPLLLWAIYGVGLGSAFSVRGAESVNYLQYLYPGVLVMIVLFTAIFSTMSIIEDRHSGFLQLALASPLSRISIALGKATGSTLVALFQGGVFLLFVGLAGYEVARVSWGMLLFVLVVGALGLTSLGFAFAWTLDSVQGYHAVMMLLLMPMWILSGSMFPPGAGVLGRLMQWNPMSYVVDGVRRSLSGGQLPAGLTVASSAAVDVAVLGSFSLLALLAAAFVCARKRR